MHPNSLFGLDSFAMYLLVKRLHVATVVVSGSLFLLRGLWMTVDSPRLRQFWVRVGRPLDEAGQCRNRFILELLPVAAAPPARSDRRIAYAVDCRVLGVHCRIRTNLDTIETEGRRSAGLRPVEGE
jgi:hypothetical protein